MVAENFFVGKPKIPVMSFDGDEIKKNAFSDSDVTEESRTEKNEVPTSYPSFLRQAEPSAESFVSPEYGHIETENRISASVDMPFSNTSETEKSFFPERPAIPISSVPENVSSEENTVVPERPVMPISSVPENISSEENTVVPERPAMPMSSVPENISSEENTVVLPLNEAESTDTVFVADENNLNDNKITDDGETQEIKSEEVSGDSEKSTESIKQEIPSDNIEEGSLLEETDYKSATFLDDLFSNGNECITAPSGSFPVKDDTRALLALFSNGRFFVSESARFYGKVLGFEYLARRRRMQIGKPEYVPTIVINDIYEYVARNMAGRFIQPTVETDTQEQVRMQRDFVTIVSRAAMQHVSDIHIVVAEHTTVMFRVNGLMNTEMEYNRDWGESFVRAAFASADISDANYAQNEYQAAQKLGRTPLRGSGGRLNLPRNVLGIRLQFNPIAFGSRYVVMRLLYAEDGARDSSDLAVLGFTEKECNMFYEMRANPVGMIVVSGPTGSGKSTTLQRNMIAMLQEQNYEINLITVEDPPEYPIPGARQMPVTNAMVEEAKDREFTKALSAALRSDPDALMIGEIRTLSAADLAFRGALSGHNVWTTLHANSAPAILMRLKDIGVEDFKLQDPSIMKGLMAQRLFRKLCPHCRQKAIDNLKHPAVQRLRNAFGDIALEQSYLRGSGCEECDFRGVKGRTVIAEFIQPDATFLDLSIRGESQKAMNYWINDLNGITLRDSALQRMLKGIVDIEEVERWTGFLDQQVMA